MSEHFDITRKVETFYTLSDDPFAFGTTSNVYTCKSVKTGETFACKVIDKRKMFSRQRHRCNPGIRMKAEILNCAKLRHSNLIKMIDVFETEADIYVVMEMLKGGQLFNYLIERSSLRESQAAQIVGQVTKAIAYMHEQNVIHRDLKAENVLIVEVCGRSRSLVSTSRRTRLTSARKTGRR